MPEDRQPPAQRSLMPVPNAIVPGRTPCSAGLWKLLTEGEDGGSAVRLIAINATLRAECERVLPVLMNALAPDPDADRHDLDMLHVLIRHAPTFGIQAKSDAEWGALFGVYLDTLGPLPVPAIEEAFARWNRGEMYPKDPGRHAFYPKPAELFALADPYRRELRGAIYRARKALEHVEQQRPRISDEERKANGERLKALLAEMATSRKPPQARRPDGLTPQQLAEQLRAKAQAATNDDIGDVI